MHDDNMPNDDGWMLADPAEPMSAEMMADAWLTMEGDDSDD